MSNPKLKFLSLPWCVVLACAWMITPGVWAQKTTSPTKTPLTQKTPEATGETSVKPTGDVKREDDSADKNNRTPEKKKVVSIPDPKQVGGEPDGIVQVANLVYAGTKSSECFSDHFLVQAEKDSAISTSRRFHAIKLSSDEIYNFPMVIMTGEGSFVLPDAERENLKRFVERGGFLLASAGCSSSDWDTSFRREMTTIFGENRMKSLDLKHPVFHTVTDIESIQTKHGQPKPLEGISFESRLGVLYSQDGLNDSKHTTGCCCCGGNEISNCIKINVNVLAYALTH